MSSYRERKSDFLKLAKYIRENIAEASDDKVSRWLWDIFEEGFFEGVRNDKTDDNRKWKRLN